MLKLFENLQNEINTTAVSVAPNKPIPPGVYIVGEASEDLKKLWNMWNNTHLERRQLIKDANSKFSGKDSFAILTNGSEEDLCIMAEYGHKLYYLENQIHHLGDLFWDSMEAEYPELKGKKYGIAPGWQVYYVVDNGRELTEADYALGEAQADSVNNEPDGEEAGENPEDDENKN